jgi:glycosyltransferase involved in cell wall biosynthesis
MNSGDVRRSGPARPLCNLHVCHRPAEAAGSRWARDFSANDPFSRNLILESVGDRDLPVVEYHLLDGASGNLIDSLLLRAPIGETAASRAEYLELVEAAVRVHHVGHVYISSLIGHAPELLELAMPVTIVHRNPAPGQESRDRYLRVAATRPLTHVAPAHGYLQAIRKIDPRFQEIDFAVIEDGVEAAPDGFGGATDGRRLRVAVLGTRERNQGSGLLSQAFDALRLLADLYVIGSDDCNRHFESRWGVTLIAGHQEEDLKGVLRDISPDLGLLLSVLPDSDAYDLLELQVRGIPPLAARRDVYQERISHGVDGFLFSPDGRSLVTLLTRLDARREELRMVARRLRRKHMPTVREMVCRYYSLRRGLPGELERILEGRRPVGLAS